MRALARWLFETSGQLGNTMASVIGILIEGRAVHLPHAAVGDRPCLVLGNGPSLKHDIVSRMSSACQMNLLCVNDFVFSDLYEHMRPSTYLILDQDYWHDDVIGVRAEQREKFFHHLETKTVWPLTLLVPRACVASKAWIRRGGIQNSNVLVSPINRNPIMGFQWFRHIAYRLNLGIPWSQNVLVAACFFAVNIGFRRIYVLGADHSWFEELQMRDDNILCVRQEHFYDSEVPPVPFYKAGSQDAFRMHEIFEAWAKAFKGYFVVKTYAESRGATIYNASSKSYVDAFPRVPVAELLALDTHAAAPKVVPAEISK